MSWYQINLTNMGRERNSEYQNGDTKTKSWSDLPKDLGCAWKSLSTAYLILSSYINTFDKNCTCLEELVKIAYNPPNLFLAYFNKLHEEAYQKKFIQNTKTSHFNNKNVFLKNNEKNYVNKRLKF